MTESKTLRVCADFLNVDFLEAGVSHLAKSGGDSAQNLLLWVNERYGDLSPVDEQSQHQSPSAFEIPWCPVGQHFHRTENVSPCPSPQFC